MADEERELRPFSEWLGIQRKGKLAEELATALADVNRAVIDTGKPGSLTLTIKVKSAGDEVSVIVTDEVKAKLPEHDRGQSIFFVDEDGNAHRSQQTFEDLHPSTQPPLAAVREINPAATEVDAETGEVR